MAEGNFTRDNHYLSQAYLKHWESSPGKVLAYHALVSNEKVPLWTERSIKGIGYHQHLYTRQIAGVQSDGIERWFSAQFESPAELPIQKVIENDRLTPEDWDKLVRFLAMHDVRTPARLMEFLQRHTKERLEKTMEKTVEKGLKEFERIKQSGNAFPVMDEKVANFPIKITTEKKEGEPFVNVKVETAAGRAFWLSSIEHILSNTVKVLHQHKWTIIRPAHGMSWFTTDKPVIRLNFDKPRRYNFNGGWGSRGTEILLPLGPEHMLYTRIGHKSPMRGSRFSVEQTNMVRRLIAEHAYRYVFGSVADADVSIYRPRIVNLEMFKGEQAQWQHWHVEQTEVEQNLLGRSDNYRGL